MHWHLGHASFGCLKNLFSSLYAKCDVSSFCYDVYELAKSHHASFLLILNKSPIPFMIIHFDVWGTSKVLTLGGSCWFVTFIEYYTWMAQLCLTKSKGDINLIFQNLKKNDWNLVQCKSSSSLQRQWWRILKFRLSRVSGSIKNHSSNHLFQYTPVKWG